MQNPLVSKLEQFTRLSADDTRAIVGASTERVRQFDARTDIIREGDRPESVGLVLSGWVYRYKQLEDGRRQIISYVLPGDVCDLNVFLLRRFCHSLGTLTPVSYATLSRPTVEALMSHHPRLAQALSWEALVSTSIQREWAVCLGQRNAYERLGHLFCELFLRSRGVGLADGNSCPLPMTQADLADTTGLSAVHVNRTLQELRGDGLIVLRGKSLTILDLPALMRASLFDPAYLHMDRAGRHLDAPADGPLHDAGR